MYILKRSGVHRDGVQQCVHGLLLDHSKSTTISTESISIQTTSVHNRRDSDSHGAM